MNITIMNYKMNINSMTIHNHLKQHLGLVFCIGLGAALLFTLLHAFWQWHNDWLLAHQAVPHQTTAIINTDDSAAMIAAIPNDHLFGQSFTNNNLPITNLQLRVTGIVKVDAEQGASKAYISIAGQPSKIYQIGDKLPYGVNIYAISTDTVILENDGHLEKLTLSREKLQFKPRNIKESL